MVRVAHTTNTKDLQEEKKIVLIKNGTFKIKPDEGSETMKMVSARIDVPTTAPTVSGDTLCFDDGTVLTEGDTLII